MSLLHFFEWAQALPSGEAIRRSLWLFPAIESVHLLGLSLVGGAVLMVNLRLAGFGLREVPLRQVAENARPWFLIGLMTQFISGPVLFTSEAVKCYAHTAFWVKMTSLALALLFTFTVVRKVTMAKDGKYGPRTGKIVALISITLWTGVGMGARWIGFS
jgi:hypothetical protein